MEAGSGKSLVALGLMELLSARVERLGFFRPIVPSGEPDPQLELVRSRYGLTRPYEELHALTQPEADAIDDYEELRKRVLHAYRPLAEQCDFVLVEGSDFTGVAAGLAFGLNADLANELGAPVLVVVKGGTAEATVAAVHVARESLTNKGCAIFGFVVNRAPAEHAADIAARLEDEAGDPIYVLAEQPGLDHPTVGEVAETLGAEILVGPPDSLNREVRDVRVGAMSVEHFLEQLVEGALVLVPSDRNDVLLATLASSVHPSVPPVSGVVVTGSYPLSETMRGLLDAAPFAVLATPELTHVAAAAVATVRPVLRADNERKLAAALGLFESSVDTAELGRRIALARPERVTPLMFEYDLIERARADRRHIVLPEGDDDRILRAAELLLRRGVCRLTILGAPEGVRERAASLGVDLQDADVVDPVASPLRVEYAGRYFELRKHRGMTEERALDILGDPNYFGTMMVQEGLADGMVSGAAHTTGDTIRPAFEIIRAREGTSVVSSVFFMCLPDRVLVYGDCAVNPQPDPQQLADIAISSAETAAQFGVTPRIAMLSYSTGTSGSGPDVDAVREATEAVRERRPDLSVEGPIQYDAAVDASVAALKLPGSEVAGQATVLVFPDLDTGNVAYKAVQRSSGAVAIGPVLQGLRKPVNDLSRGCTVTDIVNTVAITGIQAQARVGAEATVV
jgi:phosphate acetyltransferase